MSLFARPRIAMQEREDGCLLLRSVDLLQDYPGTVVHSLRAWAVADPDYPLVAQRGADGSWRACSYGAAVAAAAAIGQANYSAAKAGLFGLTKTLALETATKGITVNCVIPGAIKTDMVATLPEEIVKAVVDTIPMHALGTPEDVAEAVRYLVSDEAHYLTGTLIPVAGGWLMM